MDIFAIILTEHFVNTYKTKESLAKYILSGSIIFDQGFGNFAFILTEHFVNTYKTKESIAKYILSRCPPNRLVKYSGIV